MNRDNLTIRWRVLLGVTLGATAMLPMLAGPSLGRSRPRAMGIQNVLRAGRIGRAAFGTAPPRVIHMLDRLLRHRPTERLHVFHACGVDHAIGWPGLVVFLRGNRFVGYSYRPAYGARQVPILATARGLRVGDTLGQARALYGRDFHSSRHHGGSWWATTPEGRVEGLASGWPARPLGSVATIAAGHVGCPGSSP
jgi:hypothetical protein